MTCRHYHPLLVKQLFLNQVVMIAQDIGREIDVQFAA